MTSAIDIAYAVTEATDNDERGLLLIAVVLGALAAWKLLPGLRYVVKIALGVLIIAVLAAVTAYALFAPGVT
ncbi:MAG: hypothetical protein ACRDXX_15225 [Stackebrandtia sp.]